MDRRCYCCTTKFTVFKKECGCKNCGRSFCSKCVGFRAVVPRCGDTQQNVCKQCQDELISGVPGKNKTANRSPPANYKKRIAVLEAKQNQVGSSLPSVTKTPSTAPSQYQRLSKEDRAIAERLEKLKQETKPKSIASAAEIESRLAALKNDPIRPIPSTHEMEDRLAVLQGVTPPSKVAKPVHQPPDTRTAAQKAEDLLTQLTEEVAIDGNYSPAAEFEGAAPQPMNNLSQASGGEEWAKFTADLNPTQLQEEKDKLLAEAAAELKNENTRDEKIVEIGKRLAVLRGENPDDVTLEMYKLPESDEEMEEEDIQRIMKQLTEEAALDEASGYNIPANQACVGGPPKQNHPNQEKTPVQPNRGIGKRTDLLAKKPDSDDEQLPWCCICNENATLRCHGCDDDLYCNRCFLEGHDKYERQEHKTSSYQPPRKKK